LWILTEAVLLLVEIVTLLGEVLDEAVGNYPFEYLTHLIQ